MSNVEYHKAEQQEKLTLSDSARAHLLKGLEASEEMTGIRLSVKKTGCSGMAYVVDYVQALANDDITMDLNGKYQIGIEKGSYPYLKGIHIDFISQGLNKKLVFSNPNQTGQCGCGESFTIAEER